MQRPGKTPTLHRILFGHDHRQIIAKPQIFGLKTVMVGKGMFYNIQALSAQMGKEAPGIADTRHPMDAAPLPLA